MWDHLPAADELLDDRLMRGWEPTPTMLTDGPKVLGYAACRIKPAASSDLQRR